MNGVIVAELFIAACLLALWLICMAERKSLENYKKQLNNYENNLDKLREAIDQSYDELRAYATKLKK